MMVRWIYIVVLLLLAVNNRTNAQNYQKTAFGIKASIDSIEVEIQFYSPSTVRILKWPKAHNFTKESLSVIKKPENTAVNIKQQGDVVNLTTKKLRVGLNVKSGEL